MKLNTLKLAAALSLASFGSLAATTVSAHDQDGPTYLLANLVVEDMDAYMSNYITPLGPVLQAAGGEVLVFAPQVTTLEGDYAPNVTVVVRFPSEEAANAFYVSDAYAALRPFRQASTDRTRSTLVLAPEFTMPSGD